MSEQSQPPPAVGPAPTGEPPTAFGGAAEDPELLAMERVRPIVEAAEQASAAIIAEAEEQARRHVEESRARAEQLAAARTREMWSVADDLIVRSEGVRQRSDELLRALSYAKEGLEEALRSEGPPPTAYAPVPAAQPMPQPYAQPQPQPQSQPYARPEPQTPPYAPPPPPPAVPPPGGAAQPSEGARLLATQMAVAGSTREEISNRLFNEFGVQEPGPMLDAILGPAAR